MKIERNFKAFIDFMSPELEVPTICLVTGGVSVHRDRCYKYNIGVCEASATDHAHVTNCKFIRTNVEILERIQLLGRIREICHNTCSHMSLDLHVT